MASLTFLLTVPGDFLFDVLFPSGPPADSEARAPMAIALGVAFWGVACVAIRVVWRIASRGVKAAFPAARVAAWWRSRTFIEVWSIAWRAQAVHAAIYAVLPLLWEAARFAFIAVTLPLWIIGPGSGFKPTDGTLDHLRQPACWTFVTLCQGPRSNHVSARMAADPDCRREPCPTNRSLPGRWADWIIKGLWALLALAWVVTWRRGRPAVACRVETRPRGQPPRR